MLKNVHEACETLEAAKVALDKTTLVVAMESNVSMTSITMRRKIEVAQCELKKEGPLDLEWEIQLETKIKVHCILQ